jgi:hypothetical protein
MQQFRDIWAIFSVPASREAAMAASLGSHAEGLIASYLCHALSA